MLNSQCGAQSFAAADYATNSTYAGGWAAGQNGGHGFGAWSFDGTDPAGSPLQTMSTASALGRSWTLINTNSSSGLANAGRSIPGGLQVGQTFEAFIVNPSATQFFRGWEITFLDNTDNDNGGDKTGEAMSVYHFEYFNYGAWQISDLLSGNQATTLNASDTNPGGMKLDLTLTATNAYHLVLTPLSNPSNVYTHDGNLKTNAINWVQFQMFNTASSGTNDIANNFEISSMTIQGTLLHISWTTNTPGFLLESSPSLGADAVWSSNLPAPTVLSGSNVVTVVAAGPQQFYRLQLQQ